MTYTFKLSQRLARLGISLGYRLLSRSLLHRRRSKRPRISRISRSDIRCHLAGLLGNWSGPDDAVPGRYHLA